jgi:hypothetical protein
MLRFIANLAAVLPLLAPAYAAAPRALEKVLITHSSESISIAPTHQAGINRALSLSRVVDYRILREVAGEFR